MHFKTLFLLGFTLLHVFVTNAEGLSVGKNTLAKISRPISAKENGTGATRVIQDDSRSSSAEVFEDEPESGTTPSCSIVEKVHEIFVRVLAEIDALLSKTNSRGGLNLGANNTNSTAPTATNQSQSDNHHLTKTSSSSSNFSPPDSTSSGKPTARLCRQSGAKKECQCGSNKAVYDTAKFKCTNGQVIPRQGAKVAWAAVPALASLAKTILEAIVNQWKHLGNSHGTYLELINDSDGALAIEVSDIDNGDWDGDSRPDKTFHEAVIEPRSNLKKRQEINAKRSSAMSTMKFRQNGEEAFSMRIDQWAAKADKEMKEDFDLENGWKAHMTAGIGGDTLQYRFEKP